MNVRAPLITLAAAMLLLAIATPPARAGEGDMEDTRSAVAFEDQAPTQTLRRQSGLCCPVPDACPCPKSCWPNPLLRLPCLDDCLDEYKKGRDAACLKLSVGAYHWWNYQNRTDRFTYGYPGGGEGTYFYYLKGDIECTSCGCNTFGAHVEARFRDDTSFRPFFDHPVWVYEAYGFWKTPRFGTVKAGKIWTRFGLDWDGSFWGNAQYYNGWKLDPEWGVSWEHAYNWTRLSVPFYAQFFIGEDGVNGSIGGGDSESSTIYEEEWTAVLRVAPTYHVNKNVDLTVGLSGLVGGISNTAGPSETRTAFAGDVTLRWCDFKVYGEYTFQDGVVHEAHYVTGGPSDTKNVVLAGAQYTYGPLTGRVTYSHGEYENPGGSEDLLLLGLDVAVTQWLTFTFEYVDWTVEATGAAQVQFEDGLQFVLHWSL